MRTLERVSMVIDRKARMECQSVSTMSVENVPKCPRMKECSSSESQLMPAIVRDAAVSPPPGPVLEILTSEYQ